MSYYFRGWKHPYIIRQSLKEEVMSMNDCSQRTAVAYLLIFR